MDNEMKKSLVYATKANDVDERGVVTVAVNGIGIEDSQKDISMPGSFDNTLKEDINRMRWFRNHDVTELLGVPIEGAEKDGNLVMVGKLNLEKQIGRDTLADYKLYAEAGRTLEHSIGVKAIKRDKGDKRKVLQWQMFEYSTLTHWGSNPQTFLVGLKSATRDQVKEAVEFIQKAFMMHGYSEERLKNYNMELELLLKSLNGDNIVTCPHCGHQFDYDSLPEQTFSQQALEMAGNYVRWITEDIVREEMNKLQPEIRAEVCALIDTHKGDRIELTEKAITELAHYVRCPHCWSRVYRTMTLLKGETPEAVAKAENSAETNDKPKADFWQTLNEIV